MTSKNSPVAQLQAQANKIAETIKRTERGEITSPGIQASFQRGYINCGVAMDDGILSLVLPWSLIRETDETALAALIVAQMQGSKAATRH